MTDEELILAWLDGDLEPGEAARAAQLVDRDASLRELAARYRELRRHAGSAFAGDLAEPVPAHWIERIDAAFAPAAPVQPVDLDAFRAARRAKGSTWIWSGALAASMVAAFVAGRLTPQDRPGLVRDREGVLVASSALSEGLSEARSGAARPLEGQVMKIALSVRTAAGNYCREAVIEGTGVRQHLLACRDKGEWRIEGLARTTAAEGGEYALASGSSDPMDSLLRDLGGEVLDEQSEVRAITHRWKAQR